MVFEAIVVDILNRVLGEYVENLDTSQLKIGIWGGEFRYSKKICSLIIYVRCLNISSFSVILYKEIQ